MSAEGQSALLWSPSSVQLRTEAAEAWEAPLQMVVGAVGGVGGGWQEGVWSSAGQWPALRTEIRYLDQDLLILIVAESLENPTRLPPLVFSRSDATTANKAS